MSDCGICCEGFNKSNHKKVDCPFCDLKVCRACVQRYLLETSNDAHCMGCKSAWGREVVDEACTKTFRNRQFKEHRENILMERERCRLPETQPYVERRIRAMELTQDLVNLNQQIRALYRERSNLEDQIHAARYNTPIQLSERRQFVRKCPVEDCRGFLSTAWKCGVCSNRICSECNEIRGDGHECDPNNVETVRLLKRDTKPCPKCGTMIFKISGCSQMWCPDCHTAFCWNTGRIEAGIIHNPHYYEFQRNSGARGRNHGDIPCGGLPDIRELRVATRGLHEKFAVFFTIHRLVVHIDNVELRWYYRDEPQDDGGPLEMRIRYLMNEITEDEMKQALQRREKAACKNRDIRGILQMFVDTTADQLRQFVLEPQAKADEVYDILEKLREYYNRTIHKIGHRYNNVVPTITSVWNIDKVRAA